MTAEPQLAMEDGLFQLVGAEPIWIWAHTCPSLSCRCRSALILATTEGREALLRRITALQVAWLAGTAYSVATAQLEGVDVFRMDIDSVQASPVTADQPLSPAAARRVRVILERLDGEVLDAIGRLFFRGKGKPDPESRLRGAKKVEIKGWSRDEMLAFDDILGVRQDLYLVGEKRYQAAEMYCPNPRCSCGEVVVDFERYKPRRPTPVGRVVIPLSGVVRIEPEPGRLGVLDELWTAFKRRHRRYRERFARRITVLKEIGSRLSPDPEAPRTAMTANVGRNDPCPCGSGKKYKKCCAAAVAASAESLGPAIAAADRG